jgi:hypothetical protein
LSFNAVPEFVPPLIIGITVFPVIVPLITGLVNVLLVKVSAPARVAKVPVSGKVSVVVFVAVNVVE